MSLLNPASLPDSSDFPNRLFAVGGLGVGLLFGVPLALLHSRREEKRRSLRQGLPVSAAMMKAFSTTSKRNCHPRSATILYVEPVSSFTPTAFPKRRFLLGSEKRERTATVRHSAKGRRFSKRRFPDTLTCPNRTEFADKLVLVPTLLTVASAKLIQ